MTQYQHRKIAIYISQEEIVVPCLWDYDFLKKVFFKKMILEAGETAQPLRMLPAEGFWSVPRIHTEWLPAVTHSRGSDTLLWLPRVLTCEKRVWRQSQRPQGLQLSRMTCT